jgi:transposase
MSRRSLTVRDVTEILVHWQAGRSLKQLVRSLGVSRNTVRKYVQLATSLGYQQGRSELSASEWAAILKEKAPDLVCAPERSPVYGEIARYHESIVAALETNLASTVWQRLHDEQGLRASLRSFRRYLHDYLPEHSKRTRLTVLRDDPPPGQEAQIDYGYLGLWPDPESERRRKLWAFVMILSHSRHMFVYVVHNMSQEAWIQAHVEAFGFFDGTPALLVIDNLKTGVLKPDLYEPQINRGYAELATYYGLLIDPCRAGKPKDKPRVERPIPYIRDSFFAGRDFDDLEEMNQAAKSWCLCVAGQRVHGTTGQRPLDLFQRVEAPVLGPLPPHPFEPVTWTQAKVARDCHIQVARTLYSVPYRYVGKTLSVRLSPRTIECYLDEDLVKTHPRLQKRGRQTDWGDYPQEKARFYQRTPDWCRTQALRLGPAVAQAVEALLSLHTLHYLRQCQGIIGLSEKYGPERLNAACERALAFGDPAYPTIRNILQKGLEGQEPLPLQAQSASAESCAGAYLHGPHRLFGHHPDDDERTPYHA